MPAPQPTGGRSTTSSPSKSSPGKLGSFYPGGIMTPSKQRGGDVVVDAARHQTQKVVHNPSSSSSSSSTHKKPREKTNRDYETILTNFLKQQGHTASIEVLTSWLYQRAIVRYRMKDFLSCSRDCDRIAEKCAGCVHGRILFLNAKAHFRLKNWRQFGLNLYRSCVEAVQMDYMEIFPSVGSLCCCAPIFDETEDLFTGVMLVLQKSAKALLSLLNSDNGVKFFWHVIVDDGAKSPPALFRATRNNTSKAEGWDQIVTSGHQAANDINSPVKGGGGGVQLLTPTVISSSSQVASMGDPPRSGNKKDQEPLSPSSSPTTSAKNVQIVSNLDEGINVTDEIDEQLSLEQTIRQQCLKRSEFLESLGLKTLVFGLTEIRNRMHKETMMSNRSSAAASASSRKVNSAEQQVAPGAGTSTSVFANFQQYDPLFRSLVKFINPDVNLHLSFTTITLYSELLATSTAKEEQIAARLSRTSSMMQSPEKTSAALMLSLSSQKPRGRRRSSRLSSQGSDHASTSGAAAGPSAASRENSSSPVKTRAGLVVASANYSDRKTHQQSTRPSSALSSSARKGKLPWGYNNNVRASFSPTAPASLHDNYSSTPGAAVEMMNLHGSSIQNGGGGYASTTAALDVDRIFPKVMDCFLSEKNELIHACARFLTEMHRSFLYREKVKFDVLDYFVKWLAQDANPLRAFILCTLFPVLANASFGSAPDSLSVVDELANEEKRNLLKLLKLAVERCVFDGDQAGDHEDVEMNKVDNGTRDDGAAKTPSRAGVGSSTTTSTAGGSNKPKQDAAAAAAAEDVTDKAKKEQQEENRKLWEPLRKQILGFLFLFLEKTSDPEADTLLLARNLDAASLAKFLLQKSAIQTCLKSTIGAIALRRIASFGWMFEEFAENRVIDKIIDELEKIHEKLYAMGGASTSGPAAAAPQSRSSTRKPSYVADDTLTLGEALSSPRAHRISQRQGLSSGFHVENVEDDENLGTSSMSPTRRGARSTPNLNKPNQNTTTPTPQKRHGGSVAAAAAPHDQQCWTTPKNPPKRLSGAGGGSALTMLTKNDNIVSRLEALGSQLLRLLGMLLLKMPDLRFGVDPGIPESDKEAAERESKQEKLQKELQQQFLARVGTFPTYREQWVLSLEPAVRTCNRGVRLGNVTATDLQRICRGHRLSSLFAEFSKSGKMEGEIYTSPLNKLKAKNNYYPTFEETMRFREGGGGGARSQRERSRETTNAKTGGTKVANKPIFDGGAIERKMRIGD
ncbi:unnamed protein product [Amoebophrya sp. A120]|nr:unnamed protein product [Amoebophrya sp. A120]|eukprot:GSA120T00007272001.1